MTISSSLNASVAGLNVNASKLATISDNIANAGTYGYKRADADFSALVVSSGNGGYTAGGVTATATREISAQGSIVSTEQALDLAVVGRHETSLERSLENNHDFHADGSLGPLIVLRDLNRSFNHSQTVRAIRTLPNPRINERLSPIR